MRKLFVCTVVALSLTASAGVARVSRGSSDAIHNGVGLSLRSAPEGGVSVLESPARVGLRRSDRIVRVGTLAVTTPEDFFGALRRAANAPVRVELIRAGRRALVEISAADLGSLLPPRPPITPPTPRKG